MTEPSREYSGKTVEEAIADGLSVLGLTEAEVDIEVIQKGSRGILGFGSEPALVRLTPRGPSDSTSAVPATALSTDTVQDGSSQGRVEPSTVATELEPAQEGLHVTDEVDLAVDGPPEIRATDASFQPSSERDPSIEPGEDAATGNGSDTPSQHAGEMDDELLAQMASDLLGRLINLMEFDAEIDASWHEADETTGSPYLLLDIRGDNLGTLIGRRGETLASIQYLIRLMVNQQVRQWKNIIVDVEQYKQRRVAQLTQLSERMARQVAETGRAVTLEPMPGSERRIVHMTLRDDPDVFTESTGDGERRKVNIFPRR